MYYVILTGKSTVDLARNPLLWRQKIYNIKYVVAMSLQIIKDHKKSAAFNFNNLELKRKSKMQVKEVF